MAKELSTCARMFAIMGMYPVSYYNLSGGVPVHQRFLSDRGCGAVPEIRFVFFYLLRLDLIETSRLRERAAEITSLTRNIFTRAAAGLIDLHESEGEFLTHRPMSLCRSVRNLPLAPSRDGRSRDSIWPEQRASP